VGYALVVMGVIIFSVAITFFVLPLVRVWLDDRSQRRAEERRAQFHSVRFPDEDRP